ncbi:MAG: ankyrin [Desulfobacteraceae bacterium]|nr:MAG: ankyrin [Desulfobacteraceae bacterium]
MAEQVTCPKCKGKKIIVGNCECNPEWRASDGDDHFDDCQCEPDIDCPECQGKGYITQV